MRRDKYFQKVVMCSFQCIFEKPKQLRNPFLMAVMAWDVANYARDPFYADHTNYKHDAQAFR